MWLAARVMKDRQDDLDGEIDFSLQYGQQNPERLHRAL